MKSNDQGQFADRVIESPELEEALDEMMEHQGAAKAYRAAQKKAKKIVDGHEFEPDTRVRCGRFVWEMKLREGSGGEIPPYSKVVMGKVEEEE